VAGGPPAEWGGRRKWPLEEAGGHRQGLLGSVSCGLICVSHDCARAKWARQCRGSEIMLIQFEPLELDAMLLLVASNWH